MVAELTTRTIRQGFYSQKAYGLRVARKVPDAGDFLLFSGVYVTLMEHLLCTGTLGLLGEVPTLL